MNCFAKGAYRALHPHPLVCALLAIASAVGLTYVFVNGLEESVPAYAVYVLSFYALCVLAAAAPSVFRACRARVYRNGTAARYLSDREYRMRVSLYAGTAISLAYAALKLLTGVYVHSTWFGAVGVYYMVLCILRYLLVRNDRSARRREGEAEDPRRVIRIYFTCGMLLFALNAAMSGMVFKMIWDNEGFRYPGFLIYATAAYTFYRLTMAIINTARMRHSQNAVFAIAKALDLCAALMSIFVLQSAMFDAFGAEMSVLTQKLMNTLTGGAVCLSVVCMAVMMTIRAARAYRLMREGGSI